MQQFLVYSNFKTKMYNCPFVYLSMHMRGIKRSRGEEFTGLQGHSCAFALFNNKGLEIFFTESIDAHAVYFEISC